MRSLLEYSKVILEKVSFDLALFEKELVKAISGLVDQEASELLNWCMRHFGPGHQNIIVPHLQALGHS